METAWLFCSCKRDGRILEVGWRTATMNSSAITMHWLISNRWTWKVQRRYDRTLLFGLSAFACHLQVHQSWTEVAKDLRWFCKQIHWSYGLEYMHFYAVVLNAGVSRLSSILTHKGRSSCPLQFVKAPHYDPYLQLLWLQTLVAVWQKQRRKSGDIVYTKSEKVLVRSWTG